MKPPYHNVQVATWTSWPRREQKEGATSGEKWEGRAEAVARALKPSGDQMLAAAAYDEDDDDMDEEEKAALAPRSQSAARNLPR